MKYIYIVIVLLFTAGKVNSQSYTYFDIHLEGESEIRTITLEKDYVITKSSGGWGGSEFIYTLIVPIYSYKAITHNTITRLNYEIIPTYTPILNNLTSSIIQDEYGNERLVMDYFVPDAFTDNTLTFTIKYSLKVNVDVGYFNPDDALPLNTGGVDYKYINSNEWVDSDNASISAKAQEIIGSTTRQVDIVQKCAEWIKSNIAYSDQVVEKASTVYSNRAGDCDGMAHLMAAFLRSLNIPCRISVGFSNKLEKKYPLWSGNITTFSQGLDGNGQGASHACYEVYYPSLGWVAGDPAQSTVHFTHISNFFYAHGPDSKIGTSSIAASGSASSPPSGLQFRANKPDFTMNIANYTSSWSYEGQNEFTGPLNKAGNMLFNANPIPVIIGINDYVRIVNPPTAHPDYMDNTIVFDLGDQLSYYALFYDVEDPSDVVSWDWKVELYHSEGLYELLDHSQSYFNESLWQPICPSSLPDYLWTRDEEDGRIIGKVTVYCLDDDGYGHEHIEMISVGYKPNEPNLEVIGSFDNSIQISYATAGSNLYNIYYGDDLFNPSNGQNFHQGDSPINEGSETMCTLSNLEYGDVISVTASNDYGESSYSHPVIFSDYAKIPYSADFELGIADNYWTFKSAISNGDVGVSSGYGYNSNYGLTMNVLSNGTYSQNYADLHLCLINAPNVVLDFYWKDYGDEFHEDKDGIWLSDDAGINFVKVMDLDGTKYSDWSYFKLDISQLAKENGLILSKNFVIRFSQYDNYAIPTDGFSFDNISVNRGICSSLEKDAQLLYNLKPDYIYRNSTNYGDYSLMIADAWTHSGYTTKSRALIDIDLDLIPDFSTITSAKLSLFSPSPQSSSSYKHISNIIMGSSTYSSNASYIKRVTELWDENEVTWNTQPATTSENQVSFDQSVSESQDYLEIDIIDLASDLYQDKYGSQGLMLQLQNENRYTRMSFASSDHSDLSLHPKLDLSYTTMLNTKTISASKDAALLFSAHPDYYHYSSTNFGDFNRILCSEWTHSGNRINKVSIIDFDLTELGSEPVIIDAKIRLYACDIQTSSDYKQMSYLSTGSTTYKSNAAWLSRVISPWDENTVTYNSMPDFTTNNQVYLPISDSYNQDYIDIDVTAVVNDMINDQANSFGFLLHLESEEKYATMSFASSDHINSALHPELIVTGIPGYAIQSSVQKSGEKNSISDTPVLSTKELKNSVRIYPNPSSSIVYIESSLASGEITIFDIVGMKIQTKKFDNHMTKISVESWKKGIYIVKVANDAYCESKLLEVK